jgi:hypothetical protein
MYEMGHAKQRQGFKGVRPAGDMLVSFIHRCQAENGSPPTIDEIQAHMGWKRVDSVRGALAAYRRDIGEATVRLILDASRKRKVRRSA